MDRPPRPGLALLALLATAGTLGFAGTGVGVGAPASARIDTVAGSGTGGFAGDGGAATAALLTSPSDVAARAGGGFLIADTANHRIRRVDAAGVIATVAGAGPAVGATGGYEGDGVPAVDGKVRLNQPRGVSPTADGGFLVADTNNHVIRRVSAAGIITTVAGTPGAAGYGGDDGAATAAHLSSPGGVAALDDGSFLIADTGNDLVRRVGPGGVIARVAGNPAAPAGFAGTNTSALAASLNAPARVVPLAGGGFLVADTGNHRVRKVSAAGVITTVAGTGVPGAAGDGGPATAAQLDGPEGLAVRDDGSIVVADTTGERIREIAADGVIRTIAGTGTLGFSGDGGPAATAQVSHPRAVAVAGNRLRIADTFNHRVRQIVTTPATTDPTTPGTATVPQTAPPGVSPPRLRHSAVVTPTAGIVRYRVPGTGAFAPLRTATNVPLGTEVDTLRGAATVFFVTNDAGTTATGIASQGRFVLRQPRGLDRGQHAGQLDLSGPLAACATRRRATKAGGGPTASAAAAKRKGRRVKVHAKGRIKTRGKYGSAIVRGTRWTMVDRCASDRRPGTFVSVTEGIVSVRDFTRGRSVLVRRGQSYLAPARKR